MTACSWTRRTFLCSIWCSLPSSPCRYGWSVSFSQCSQKLITAAAACACTRTQPSSITVTSAGTTVAWSCSCIFGPKSVDICREGEAREAGGERGRGWPGRGGAAAVRRRGARLADGVDGGPSDARVGVAEVGDDLGDDRAEVRHHLLLAPLARLRDRDQRGVALLPVGRRHHLVHAGVQHGEHDLAAQCDRDRSSASSPTS